MAIAGTEGKSVAEIREEVGRGARFVVFPYVISILILTFQRSSAVVYLPPGASALAKGAPYLLISLLCGWWGFPFGLIFTPIAIVRVLAGGKDVTDQILEPG